MLVLGKEEKKLTLKGENVKIFSGTSNTRLAKDICDYLNIPLGHALLSEFSNGELQVRIEENVRGAEVFVIQSMCRPVNDNIMELLIMIDALTRASARRITAVVPYFGYAKQEKKTAGREPISAKLVANLMATAGTHRVVTMDLHAAAIQGFFDIPVDNLMALPTLANYFQKKGITNDDVVVVSPDAGGVARARTFAERLNGSLAIIFKRRPKPDVAEVTEVVGEVKGKTAVIIDDMISTGGTLIKGAQALIKRGVKRIYACATHAILAGNALKEIENSELKEVVVTDTVPVNDPATKGKITVLPVSPLLGEAIKRNYFNLSVSKLFL